MYSQLNEDDYILAYFKDLKDGTLLDIGANDGITLSNSRALIEKGWTGDLVEPGAIAGKKLRKLYKDHSGVRIHDFAISNSSGSCKFYESASLYDIKDSGLLSTIKKDCLYEYCLDMSTGKEYRTHFTEHDIETLSFNDFQEKALCKIWDFITIDAEGCDWDILQQMDLSALACKCLCIEYSSYNRDKIVDYCKKHGLDLVHTNRVNLILVKQ